MQRKNREISIFSMSVVDLFASALGAFIVLFMVLLPYYLKVDPELIEQNQRLQQENQQLQAQNQDLQQQLAECQAENQRLQGELAQAQSQVQDLQQQLQECRAQNQQLQQQVAALEQQNQTLEAENQRLREQAERQARLQQELQACEEARRRAEGRAASCEEKLKYTFLAVAIEWATELQDVDMHLIDPAGNEFSYQKDNRERGDFPGVDAELSKDSKVGPGVELWQTPNAMHGLYKVYATLYNRHGNSNNPTIRSAVYFRDGSKKLPEVVLTRELGNEKDKLIATIEVKDDGSVVVR